ERPMSFATPSQIDLGEAVIAGSLRQLIRWDRRQWLEVVGHSRLPQERFEREVFYLAICPNARSRSSARPHHFSDCRSCREGHVGLQESDWLVWLSLQPKWR